MAATLTIVIDLREGEGVDWRGRLLRQSKYTTLRNLSSLLNGIRGGARRATICAHISDDTAAAPSVEVVCDFGGGMAGNPFTFDGATLTREIVAANENQVAAGANTSELAANLAAAINAHSLLGGRWFAESDGVDTVTVTSLMSGTSANGATTSGSASFNTGDTSFSGGAGTPADAGEIKKIDFGT